MTQQETGMEAAETPQPGDAFEDTSADLSRGDTESPRRDEADEGISDDQLVEQFVERVPPMMAVTMRSLMVRRKRKRTSPKTIWRRGLMMTARSRRTWIRWWRRSSLRQTSR